MKKIVLGVLAALGALVVIAVLAVRVPHMPAPRMALPSAISDHCPSVVPQDQAQAAAATTGPAPRSQSTAGETPTGPTPGTPFGQMMISADTRWQPLGGEVKFDIGKFTVQPEHVSVYFGWVNNGTEGVVPICVRSEAVRVVTASAEVAGSGVTYTYAARLPVALDGGDLPNGNHTWIAGYGRWISASLVPEAEMYVRATIPAADKTPAQDILLERRVGVTTPWAAGLIALALLVVCWVVLSIWAGRRGIPGDPLLRIISTPNGVASLSQFQVFLWTMVIGTGVTYVMLLTGNLIDIPATTLGALGVTGFALVGAKLQSNADGSPVRASRPGLVTGLSTVDAPTATSGILTWSAPADTPQPFTYSVQMRQSGAGPFSPVANGLAGPPCAVAGLEGGKKYDFRVFASNGAGDGDAAMLLNVATSTNLAPPGPKPYQVIELAAAARDDETIALTWKALDPAPDVYTVLYRPKGTLGWVTFSSDVISCEIDVDGLDGNTAYEFRVFAVKNGVAGPASKIAATTTHIRLPQWADLIMSDSMSAEIDLGRLQMAVFTVIAAAFTAVALIETGQIPDIPVGELALIGLSNGIYLAHKAAINRASGSS